MPLYQSETLINLIMTNREDIGGKHFTPDVRVVSGVVSKHVTKGSGWIGTLLVDDGGDVACTLEPDLTDVVVVVRVGRLGRQFLGGVGVVTGKTVEDRRVPAPLLKELRWTLDEITLYTGSREQWVFDGGRHVVHDMAKLVEECDDFVVSQERRCALGGLGKVSDECGDGQLALTATDVTLLEWPHGKVTVLALTWMQVKEEVTDDLIVLRWIGDREQLYLWMPQVEWQHRHLLELESQQLLKLESYDFISGSANGIFLSS
ncbi:hypothetical protein PPL_05302 [Heterostelium album PN500]|uniref:Uncharacterized protein n=1 Tax=Heterostelium pallidum (strain ATCC 26659 / Pp 5 / PN500) TaxID=670386 RepID=D3BBB5_HETP5|nr:hypothetical protein PPL_05302 [Heterostelium album PN500]EFA81322.1 hypothetical protein PPL_05302 [Heterostelium album PN500]|eukprot:XP_020433440.1 hypothetical protein PPL_05302 [Heterostelium album PN500]